MSSKLRLANLPLEQDDMEEDYMDGQYADHQRKKVAKGKRKKQGSDNYMEQRSLKRDFDINMPNF